MCVRVFVINSVLLVLAPGFIQEFLLGREELMVMAVVVFISMHRHANVFLPSKGSGDF